jgi:hypothetical protein
MRTMKHFLFTFALLSLCMAFAVTSYAGWVMEQTDGTTTYLENGRVKSEFSGEGTSISHIIDSTKGIITMVDKNRKVYGSGTPEEYCEATQSFGREMQEQAMAGLPPEQRKMIEEQMRQFKQTPKETKKGNMPKPVVSIKKTGSGDIIAGHKTDKYTVTRDGDKYQDIWIASDISMQDEMKKLNLDKFNTIEKRMDKCMNMSEEAAMMSDPLDSLEYRKLTESGFIMREVYYTGAGPGGDEKTEVVRLEKKSIPDSVFKIPAGYKRLPIKELFKGMMSPGMGKEGMY